MLYNVKKLSGVSLLPRADIRLSSPVPPGEGFLDVLLCSLGLWEVFSRIKTIQLSPGQLLLLKAYRQRIPAEFAEGSPISATLPRLSPVPGSTPDPVVANGNYNPATITADLNWTASTETDTASYEVRGVGGPGYDTEDEVNLATILPGAPRTYSTNFAPAPPATPPATKSTSS